MTIHDTVAEDVLDLEEVAVFERKPGLLRQWIDAAPINNPFDFLDYLRDKYGEETIETILNILSTELQQR